MFRARFLNAIGVAVIAVSALGGSEAAYAGCPGLGAPGSAASSLTGVLYDPMAGVMKACVGDNWVSLGTGGGGGASALSGLSDVSVTGIGDGKSLVYNSTSSKWEPQTISGGGSSALATLSDVDTTGIADGKSLVYNATSSKWVPMAVSSGATTLAALTDISTTGIADGKALVYNGTTTKWEPQTISSGGGTVSGTTGQIAKFTGTAAVGDSIIMESSGKIGIGTTSPAVKLHIVGALGSTLARFTDGTNGTLDIRTPSFNVTDLFGNSTNLTLSNQSGEVMRLSGGSVGIGTTNPGSKLDVDGTVTATGFLGPGIVPAHAVMAFNRTTCPTGWSEYIPARGRFVRGIDNGAGNDPDGTRAPGDSQADDLKSHSHSVPTGYLGSPAAMYADISQSGSNQQAGAQLATNSTGGAESRPKNVALLYCEKD